MKTKIGVIFPPCARLTMVDMCIFSYFLLAKVAQRVRWCHRVLCYTACTYRGPPMYLFGRVLRTQMGSDTPRANFLTARPL